MADMNTAQEPVRLGDAPELAALQERLKEHGYDPTVEPKSEPNRETSEEAAERKARRMEGITARWARKVPAMYADADLSALEAGQHAVDIQSWPGSGLLHLVLAGPVGTGKTYAAYAVGNAALSRGIWVEAWNIGDLMDDLRPGSAERQSTWDRARHCQLLILDDLTGKATDWETERLTLLMDARVREDRRTIVTTNLTGNQITEVWGTRLMDRLRYRMTALTLSGESRRTELF